MGYPKFCVVPTQLRGHNTKLGDTLKRGTLNFFYGAPASDFVPPQLQIRVGAYALLVPPRGPMQFAFPGMHEPRRTVRPSVRFDLPYTACDKVTPRHFVRPPTPFYARDTKVTREVPATHVPITLPTTAMSCLFVHSSVHPGIEHDVTDIVVDVDVRPTQPFGDIPGLSSAAQHGYSRSGSPGMRVQLASVLQDDERVQSVHEPPSSAATADFIHASTLVPGTAAVRRRRQR